MSESDYTPPRGESEGGSVAKIERVWLRDRIVPKQDSGELDFLRLRTRCAQEFGHRAAAFIAQLLFWEGKGKSPTWIYKSAREWWDEAGLTRRHIETIRRNLGEEGAGILEEKKAGIPCTLHYRLNLEELWQVLYPELEVPQFGGLRESSLAGCANQVSTEAQTYTESTSEETNKESSFQEGDGGSFEPVAPHNQDQNEEEDIKFGPFFDDEDGEEFDDRPLPEDFDAFETDNTSEEDGEEGAIAELLGEFENSMNGGAGLLCWRWIEGRMGIQQVADRASDDLAWLAGLPEPQRLRLIERAAHIFREEQPDPEQVAS